MLTDEEAALLIRYYQTVQLTGEQKDRLVEKYWEANDVERREIARTYARVFAEDGAFLQRLMAYFDLCKNSRGNHSEPGSPLGRGDPGGAAGYDPGSGTNAVMGSPTGSSGSYHAPRLTHSQRLLRTAIQDKFPKLTGPGPFQVCFGLVNSEAERREVVDLYASQFTAPDPPELQRLVTLPQSHSTRTRRRISGNYTWYLRCLTTQEVVCAVTVTAHHHRQTHHFVEMPLFATAGGYKRNGFGRLLNAALAAWCVKADFEFILISADVNAVPFWRHMGYDTMTVSEKKKIAFYYENECYNFAGTEPLIGYCSRARRYRGGSAASQAPTSASVATDANAPAPIPLCEQTVAAVLQRMPKFAVVGPLELTTDD